MWSAFRNNQWKPAYSNGRLPFPRPELRFACRPKKIPAARNTAAISAFAQRLEGSDVTTAKLFIGSRVFFDSAR